MAFISIFMNWVLGRQLKYVTCYRQLRHGPADEISRCMEWYRIEVAS